MGQIISFSIQKGGEGKSTGAITVSAYTAMQGYKTLCIDFEPQGNSSSVLLKKVPELSMRDVIIGKKPIYDVIVHSDIPNLDVIPGNIGISDLEAHLLSTAAGDYGLKDAIEDGSLDSKYDFIFIDTPPSLGPLTLNALVASRFIIIPVQCAPFSVDGFLQLQNTIQRIKRRQNEYLEILGVFMNKFVYNRIITRDIEADIRAFYGNLVFETKVRLSVRIDEAAAKKQPIFFYDIKSDVTQDFIKLCDEILARLKTKVLLTVPSGVGG